VNVRRYADLRKRCKQGRQVGVADKNKRRNADRNKRRKKHERREERTENERLMKVVLTCLRGIRQDFEKIRVNGECAKIR
jgi:hypothetical protein